MPYKDPEKQKQAKRKSAQKKRDIKRAKEIEELRINFIRYIDVLRRSGLPFDVDKAVRGFEMVKEGFRLLKEAIPKEEADQK